MRFTKGVILTEMDRQQDAIAVFTRLSEDYPNLPEPFNNLAVLYAAQGQYEKARAALDRAIRTNPSYATAYENLGDVHARLASEAYGKALQIDAGNANAKAKLTLVRDLALPTSQPVRSPAAPGTETATASAPARPAAVPAVPAAPTPTAPVAPLASSSPSTPQAASKPAPAKPASTSSPAIAAAPQASAEKPKTPAPDPAATDSAAVLAAVESWAKAWSSRDVNAYLKHYAPDFETPGRQSRKAWAEERTARIVDKRRISVKVQSPKVSIRDGKATVRFRQSYVSDRLTSNTSKTLVMVKQRGKWLIQKESTGS